MTKYTIALVLVVVSMVSAQRSSPPYQGRGWKPTGPQFNLPQRQVVEPLPPQPHEIYGPPTPAPSYGPPTEQPEVTTTELPTTTEVNSESVDSQQTENIKVGPSSGKRGGKQPAKLEENPRGFYVVLPQGQNVLYAVPATAAGRSAPLVALERANLVQAAPPAPAPFSAVASSVFTPFSSTAFYQIYQQ